MELPLSNHVALGETTYSWLVCSICLLPGLPCDHSSAHVPSLPVSRLARGLKWWHLPDLGLWTYKAIWQNKPLSWGICYSKYKANTLNNCSFLVSYWFLFLCLTSKYFTDTELFSMLPTFFPCKGNFTKSYGSNTIYILIVTNFYFPSEPFHWISDSNQLIQHLHSMSNTCLYPNTELLSNHWQNTFLLNSSLSL